MRSHNQPEVDLEADQGVDHAERTEKLQQVRLKRHQVEVEVSEVEVGQEEDLREGKPQF